MNRKNMIWGVITTIILITSYLLVKSTVPVSALESPLQDERINHSILLYIGSSHAYVDGKPSEISPGEKIQPLLRQNRTFVPLRFIAEHYGADVTWDKNSKTILIKGPSGTLRMSIGDNRMYVNGRTVKMDAAPVLYQNRAFVPIRAVSEGLDKHVFWDPSGLIIISGKASSEFDSVKDRYLLHLTALLFAKQIPVVSAIASSDDGHIPANAIDGDLNTRWSAQGDNQWIQFDLGREQEVGYAAIAYYQGIFRQGKFEISVSSSGNSWTRVWSGRSPKGSNNLEIYPFRHVKARFVRIIGHGNTQNDWNSFSEIEFYSPNNGETPIISLSEPSTAPPATQAIPFTLPGLTEADGSPHPVHFPNPVTGKILNVVSFGADPANNGHDDRKAVQSAIDAARPGDEVYFPDGVYNLRSANSQDDASQLLLKSGVNLRGQSMEKTIIFSDVQNNKNDIKVMTSYGRYQIRLSQFTVSSNFHGKFSSDYRRPNPQKGGPAIGININNRDGVPSYNITINRVKVENFQNIGIRIGHSRDIVVSECVIQKATDVSGGGNGYGVAIMGVPKQNPFGTAEDTLFNLVENNRFIGPYLRHGVIIAYFAHNNLVRNNTFTNTALDSIDLHGEDEYLNEIERNRISGSLNESAIGVGNIGGKAPYNHDASGPGNYIHHNVISDGKTGICVSMGSPNTVIESNIIKNSADSDAKGIWILNAPHTIVKNNEITNNTSLRFWGILLQHDQGDPRANHVGAGDPLDIRILDNQITGNSNGVWISAGSQIELSGNTIKDNQNTDYKNDLEK